MFITNIDLSKIEVSDTDKILFTTQYTETDPDLFRGMVYYLIGDYKHGGEFFMRRLKKIDKDDLSQDNIYLFYNMSLLLFEAVTKNISQDHEISFNSNILSKLSSQEKTQIKKQVSFILDYCYKYFDA